MLFTIKSYVIFQNNIPIILMVIFCMDFLFIILKTIIFFVLLVIVIRLLGKREVGEISVFDLVVLLNIADIATLGIDGNYKEVLLAITSVLTLLVLQKIISFFMIKFPKIRGILDYKPSIIIFDGKINLREMRKQYYTIDDLLTQARIFGVMDLNEINVAILEPSGELSVFKKEDYKNKILPVVISSQFVDDNLEVLNLKRENIIKYLKEKRININELHYLSSDGKSFFLIEEMK